MNNLTYDEWRFWVDKTYEDNQLLKSVFTKLLDAWGIERHTLRVENEVLKAQSHEINVELDMNFIAKTKAVEDALRAQLESTKESLRDILRLDNQLRVEAQKWHDHLQIAVALLGRLSEWDMLNTYYDGKPATADGPYWKREIDEALRQIEGSEK